MEKQDITKGEVKIKDKIFRFDIKMDKGEAVRETASGTVRTYYQIRAICTFTEPNDLEKLIIIVEGTRSKDTRDAIYGNPAFHENIIEMVRGALIKKEKEKK